MIVDYSKGKIYNVWDNGYNMCYVGSTTQPLSKRMEWHRRDYKQFSKGNRHRITVFNIFDKYGVNNCKIELVENYTCTNKEELQAREGYFIRNTECINRCVPGRSTSEWCEDNKDRVKELKKKKKKKKQKRKKTMV